MGISKPLISGTIGGVMGLNLHEHVWQHDVMAPALVGLAISIALLLWLTIKIKA